MYACQIISDPGEVLDGHFRESYTDTAGFQSLSIWSQNSEPYMIFMTIILIYVRKTFENFT